MDPSPPLASTLVSRPPLLLLPCLVARSPRSGRQKREIGFHGIPEAVCRSPLSSKSGGEGGIGGAGKNGQRKREEFRDRAVLAPSSRDPLFFSSVIRVVVVVVVVIVVVVVVFYRPFPKRFPKKREEDEEKREGRETSTFFFLLFLISVLSLCIPIFYFILSPSPSRP